MVVFKDANRNKILWYKFINGHERISDYKEGFDWLLSNGFIIEGVVCDGQRGLLLWLKDYPVQMCQFHMKAIVRRCLTKSPRLIASRELQDLVRILTYSDKEEFMERLALWYDKWNRFINERSEDKDSKKSHYTHKRLRAAYNSLVRYSPWLWTYKDFPKRNIPNTNAGIESFNNQLKTILRVHSGITEEQRRCLIEWFIALNYE